MRKYLLILAVPLMFFLACSNNTPTTGIQALDGTDDMPYTLVIHFTVCTEDGGFPPTPFQNSGWVVTNPYVYPPILGFMFEESELNEENWTVTIIHNGTGFVGFYSQCLVATEPPGPYEDHSNWLVYSLADYPYEYQSLYNQLLIYPCR